jgi:hypothetical protein
MEVQATSLLVDELNRDGFRLYGPFRPDVPDHEQGWRANEQRRQQRIRIAEA